MKLRLFESDKDFDTIKTWITDERTHAFWSANRFSYPLDRENFEATIKENNHNYGDTPYVATDDSDTAVGFFIYSYNQETKEGMLKFIVVDPTCRGKGVAREMLRLAVEQAFANPNAMAVHLNVFPENARAKRCYEKAGFTERKTTPKAFAYKDELWDRCNMVIKRDSRRTIIETKRLTIHVASEEEMRDHIAGQTDEEMIQAYKEMLQGCRDHPEQWNWYAIWMIELKDGTHIGDLCFKGFNEDGSVEIGYGITDEYQGQGYATEAVEAAITWALKQPGVSRVEAETEPSNKKSQRVLEKCGFTPTGAMGEEGPRFHKLH